MLAFFGNLAPTEMLVLAVVAVLVFGKRLPEVAGRGYTQLRRWRQSLDQLRRETGIDHEIRSIERDVDEVTRQASSRDAFARSEPPYPGTVPRSKPATGVEDGTESSVEGASDAEAATDSGSETSRAAAEPDPKP